VSNQEQRRRELAQFLRSRRARIDPENVGFPVGPRRRTGGLRREEVAILAGVSPTWYTYLEQGRKIQPSPEVLDSLARVLRLTEDERRYVHALAFGHVVHPQPLDTEVPVDELLRQVVGLVDECPYPVYCTDPYANLTAWNQAATEWYDDWGRLPPDERNMMRWLLSPQAMERLVDWEQDTRDIVARLRGEVARRQGDQQLSQLVARCSAVSKQFVEWWNDLDVQETRSRVRRFRHPALGVQTLRLVPLQSVHLVASGIVFHVPARSVDIS
jgi:transcriptional regulator with XRE-family HTH domain